MIITCNSEGLRIQPGGYRFSLQALEKDGELLPKSLKALAVQWQASEPDVLWRPQLSFLIEPGGYASYRLARQQTILSDLDWPVSLQVVETATGGLRLGERRP